MTLFPEGGRSLDTIQTGSRVQNCIYNETKRNKKECLLDTFHKHLSQSIQRNRNGATFLRCSEFPGCVWPTLDVSSRQCASCHKTKICEIVTDSCLLIVNHKDHYDDQIYSLEEGDKLQIWQRNEMVLKLSFSRRPFLL